MAVILNNTLSILIAYWSRRWLQIRCIGRALRFQVHSSALLRMNWPEREDSVALQSRAEASCPQGRSANGTWVKITLHSVQPCLCRFGNKEAMIRQPSGGEERRRRQGRGGNAVWNRDGSDRLWMEVIGQRRARQGIHERAVTPYPHTSIKKMYLNL